MINKTGNPRQRVYKERDGENEKTKPKWATITPKNPYPGIRLLN